MPPRRAISRAQADSEVIDINVSDCSTSSSENVETVRTVVLPPYPHITAPIEEYMKVFQHYQSNSFAHFYVSQALRDSQLAFNELSLQMRKLEFEFSEYKKLHKGKSAKSQPATTVVVVEQERIAVHARRFGVMNEMMVPKIVFLRARPIGIRSDDSNRWNSELLALNGFVAEMYEEIPEDLHEMMAKHTSFRSTVRLIYSSMPIANSFSF